MDELAREDARTTGVTDDPKAATGDNNAMRRDPNAPAEQTPFVRGYREGQDDLLFCLAKGFQWALDKLESYKVSLAAAERDSAESASHFAAIRAQDHEAK